MPLSKHIISLKYSQCITVMVIGKTALFEPEPSLGDYARLNPVFTSLDFTTIFFLHSRVLSLAANPKPGGPCLCIYVPQ
jgi:hypothetical protein